MEPQVIRRRCSAELFDAVEAGTRTFDVRADTEGLEPGDYYCFVDDSDPPREMYRRVAYISRTNAWQDEARAQAEHSGFAVIGFYSAEYAPLASLFQHDSFLAAFVIEKHLGELNFLDGPVYLPLFGSINADPLQLCEHLKITQWPEGQYSVMVRCRYVEPEDGSIGVLFYVEERIVLVRSHTAAGDTLIPANYLMLLAGSLQDLLGNELTPIFGPADNDVDEDEV
jgi:hypothetical protein